MKIVASNIPSYYPVGYDEQLYLSERAVNKFRDTEISETNEKIRIKNDNSYRNRKIQTVFYDKYEIEFITTENVDVGILQVAGTLTVTLDNGDIHNAEIINLTEPEQIQNTDFLKYVFTYRDLDSKETINHLTYDSTNNSDYILDLVIFDRSEGNFNFTKTKIYPIFDVTPYEIEENTDNKIQIISFENAFKTITCYFYLSTEDKNTLKELINFEYFYKTPPSGGKGMYIEYNGDLYIPVELPSIEIEDSELEDLHPIVLTMKYEQILNYPYD